MTLFPHPSCPYIKIPLLRGFESFDDTSPCSKKAAHLLNHLFQKLPISEKVARFFEMQRLLSYASREGERTYTAPFLHHFYIPTKEGMGWLQARYLKKHNLDVKMIGSQKELSELQAAFLSSKEQRFLPIIFQNHEEMIMHVTPCLFLKNEKGAFFLHLDSMGREGSVISFRHIKEVLDPSIVMIVNREQRQRDGFSCRVDSFVLLKKLKQCFDVNAHLSETDVFQNIELSVEHAGIYEGIIKGAFMMSAQMIVSDSRKDERVFGTGCSLEEMQSHFSARYFRTITQMTQEQTALLCSSVYLQCKALKFVQECQKEIEAEENRYKDFEFRTDEDF